MLCIIQLILSYKNIMFILNWLHNSSMAFVMQLPTLAGMYVNIICQQGKDGLVNYARHIF